MRRGGFYVGNCILLEKCGSNGRGGGGDKQEMVDVVKERKKKKEFI